MLTRCTIIAFAMLAVSVPAAGQGGVQRPGAADDERAIRATLARFYEGWNAHDVEKMVSTYADDVDHVNVFAQWHRGKAAIREDLRQFHAGPARNSHKTYTIEKIRFVTPDVAVVHVRSLSTVGNLGTYVMARRRDEWLTVSFTNVGYDLAPGAPATGVTQPPSGNASTTVPVPGGCAVPRTGPADAVGCHLAGTEAYGVAPGFPLFWHIDRYPTRAAAEAARRAHGTVAEAHGGVWLFTLADSAWRPAPGAAGEHVARVGPLPVTPGRTYAAHYFEGVVPAEARTPVHRHAGPEAWYVLGGAQCLETPDGARLVRAGESFVIPEGPPMLLAGTGTATRRTLGLVLHDAAQPWTIPAADWTPKGSCPR